MLDAEDVGQTGAHGTTLVTSARRVIGSVARVGRPLARAIAVAVGVVLVVTLAWVIDLRMNSDRVVRNVGLGGTRVGGLTREGTAEVAKVLAARALQGEVSVRSRTGSFRFTPGEVRLAVDAETTADECLRYGRSGNPVALALRWALSPLWARHCPVALQLDPSALYRIVDERDPGPRRPAIEPSIRARGTEVVAVHGRPGRGIDAGAVLRALPGAVARGVPVSVRVGRGAVAPRHRIEEARSLALDAEGMTDSALAVGAGLAKGEVAPSELKRWLSSASINGELKVRLRADRVLSSLATILVGAGEPPQDARFVVEGSGVRIVDGQAGTTCCADEAVSLVEAALGSARRSVTLLPLRREDPKFNAVDARKLGIKEQIGAFTTRFPAGQPRVQNIHRAANLMRGTIIRPGAELSLNEVIGKRTADRGFVNAPVIEEGKLAEGIGGGVSQFATTFFNASFFAGLDIVEYQSHSLYISRYPFGREATLSFPKPDLRVKNPTPYGVVVWTSYTASSINVSLWSTRYVEGSQTGQTKGERGSCTVVRTERTRRYLDGRTKVDYVRAVYRAEEGLECSQPRPSSTTTSTSAPPGGSTSTTTSSSTSTTTR